MIRKNKYEKRGMEGKRRLNKENEREIERD